MPTSKREMPTSLKRILNLMESLVKPDFMGLQDLNFGLIKINLQLLFNLINISLKENKLFIETLNLFLESLSLVFCNRKLGLQSLFSKFSHF